MAWTKNGTIQGSDRPQASTWQFLVSLEDSRQYLALLWKTAFEEEILDWWQEWSHAVHIQSLQMSATPLLVDAPAEPFPSPTINSVRFKTGWGIVTASSRGGFESAGLVSGFGCFRLPLFFVLESLCFL
eukprot:CAMPEP_0201189182 /NCGR_PEP_ID=MMETSP0851-20130426/137209_1 /ASSEMBLY_ACC=CAM_ASM_000631 /TAXON_ID=183588 /ORGANISM="Pseudo-nitzschia fraudulenta, Strain WWA7" /LENGTH=128 /DNA_ID=CAMNT_0047474959 /DNA_START=22 /DNA_END=408 /DNA_ORIENTATION=+